MPAPSLAEQFCAARLAFELAMELGCTPREAEREMRRRARRRLDACGRRAPDANEPARDAAAPAAPADFRAWGTSWMMRD